jgi:hypothetical protein
MRRYYVGVMVRAGGLGLFVAGALGIIFGERVLPNAVMSILGFAIGVAGGTMSRR